MSPSNVSPITSPLPLPLSLPHIPELWTQLTKRHGKKDKRSGTVKIAVQGKKRRRAVYDMGLISPETVYEAFGDMIQDRQGFGYVLKNNRSGEELTVPDSGRWGDLRTYKRRVRKKIAKQLDRFKNPVMVTLSVHPPLVAAALPGDTNLDPLGWFLGEVGGEVSRFLDGLRKLQERSKIKWEFVAWVLEICDSGWPNIHIIFRSRWVGDIRKIVKLWRWSEPQGVDISNVTKLQKRHPDKKYTELNLANYVTKYITKEADQWVKFDESKRVVAVNRSWAWIWFWGSRQFNVSHIARVKVEKIPGEWSVIGRVHLATGIKAYWKRSPSEGAGYGGFTEEPEENTC